MVEIKKNDAITPSVISEAPITSATIASTEVGQMTVTSAMLGQDNIVANTNTELGEPHTGFKDKSPCNWAIIELEDGIIEAKNHTSGELFTGNLEEFNAGLKG